MLGSASLANILDELNTLMLHVFYVLAVSYPVT